MKTFTGTLVALYNSLFTACQIEAKVQQNKIQNRHGGKQVAQDFVGKWCFVNVNSANSGAAAPSNV